MANAQTRGRISSVDDLDKCIAVTHVGAWVVLGIAVLLGVALAVWSFTAVVPTVVSVTGVETSGTVRCWVDEGTASNIQVGDDSIEVGDNTISDFWISDVAMSKSEIVSSIGSDYLAEAVTLSDWNYELAFDVPKKADSAKAKLVPIRIVVSKAHPIDLVLGHDR